MATSSAKVYQELEIQTAVPAGGRIALESFLPHQLSVIASRVSRGLARLYAVRFDLTVPEWRIMTVLGCFPGVSANEVCELTAIDKVRSSGKSDVATALEVILDKCWADAAHYRKHQRAKDEGKQASNG